MIQGQIIKLFPKVELTALAGLFLVVTQSCINADRLECPGIICPADMACSPSGAPVCIPQGCGDGEVVVGEDCDAGGIETVDCNINCKKPKCGDGVVNQLAGEQCDKFGEETAECNSDCTISKCGDENLNQAAGEQCDDGGESENCNSDCTLFQYGDGKINSAAGEVCDDGNLENGDGCSSEGKLENCLNGVIDAYEQCDDGKETETCDDDCTERKCGDGKVNLAAGEECDHGPLGSDTCNADCTNRQCGDNIVNEAAGEECDPGTPKTDTATCTSECKKSFCGDRYINKMAEPPEQCDNGDENSDVISCPYGTKDCIICTKNTCQLKILHGPVCGDGKTDKPQEVFDDGDNLENTTCDRYNGECEYSNADCTKKYTIKGPFCGDGHIDNMAGEQCDNGEENTNATSCPYGTKNCSVCAKDTCQLKILHGPVCGDGKTDKQEVFDGGDNLENTTCDRYNGKCEYSNSDCTQKYTIEGPFCGDGIINGPVNAEQCDVKDIPEFCIVGINMCNCAQASSEINYEIDRFSEFRMSESIVVDSHSDLVWQREDDNKYYSWQGAIDYCRSLKLAGCSNWRLPTMWELESLVDMRYPSYPLFNWIKDYRGNDRISPSLVTKNALPSNGRGSDSSFNRRDTSSCWPQ